MQARVRNHSASDVTSTVGGEWEEISSPDDVRSIGSSSLTDAEDEIIIFPPSSPKVDMKLAESPTKPLSPPTTYSTLHQHHFEIIVAPSPPPSSNASTTSLIQALEDIQQRPGYVASPTPKLTLTPSQSSIDSLFKSVSAFNKPAAGSPAQAELVADSTLSPIEKTLLHQITRLSEELEVSKHKNQVLEQSAQRDDFTICADEEEGNSFFRLGLKTLGFFVLLSVVQRKFLVSGMVSILGAAVVGGLLTYEQEETRRRRGE